MVMYYRDMNTVSLHNTSLRFKLPRQLVHFKGDFDPSNSSHQIVVELSTSHAAACVRDNVLSFMRQGVGQPPRQKKF
jgi:hypothetical protein